MIEILGWLILWALARSWRRRTRARLERAVKFAELHQQRLPCGCYFEPRGEPRFCAGHSALLEAMKK